MLWNDFADTTSPFDADTLLSGFAGQITSSAASFSSAGSNDGTYGTLAGANTASANVLRFTPNSVTTADVSITNNTGSSYNITKFHLDARNRGITAADGFNLDLLSGGGLQNGGSASIGSASTTSHGGNSNISDFEDFDFDLTSVLSDTALANGESATFRITLTPGASPNETWMLDNVAVEGTIIPPTVSYDTSKFTESSANDGSIPTTINITLANGTFTQSSGNFTGSGTHYTASNVPAGLGVQITATSNTTAQLTLTGTATAHADANDISNLTIVWADAAFTGWSASAVTNYNKSDFTVNFDNNAPSVSNVVLSSASGNNLTSDNLTVASSTADVNGDSVKNIVNWYKNATSTTILNMPFEGGSTSTTTKDYSGNGLDGTAVNSPTWNSGGGHDGKGAYEFDGTNRIRFNASADFPTGTSDPWSVEAWVKNEWESGSARYYFSYGETFFNSISLGTTNGTNLLVAGWSINSFWNVGDWAHIIVTFDGTTKRLYKNGGLFSSQASGIDITYQAEAYIGAREDDSRYWIGTIDDLQVYKHSLSAEQIQEIYSNGTSKIVNQETSIGDVWRADVTPNDGTEDGTLVSSNNLTVVQGALSYNTSTFSEAAANDGSINTTINITLTGDTFTQSSGTFTGSGTHYTATNVPAGLTAVITAASSTAATLTLTGNATAHQSTNDISNLTITWADAVFTAGSSTAITNSTKSDFTVDFTANSISGTNTEFDGSLSATNASTTNLTSMSSIVVEDTKTNLVAQESTFGGSPLVAAAATSTVYIVSGKQVEYTSTSTQSNLIYILQNRTQSEDKKYMVVIPSGITMNATSSLGYLATTTLPTIANFTSKYAVSMPSSANPSNTIFNNVIDVCLPGTASGLGVSSASGVIVYYSNDNVAWAVDSSATNKQFSSEDQFCFQTTHLTSFVIGAASTSNESDTSNESGPGLVAKYYTEEPSIAINNGEAVTNSRFVTINFDDGGGDAKWVAISNSNDFSVIGLEYYTRAKEWTLTEGQGDKTIYAIFYNQQGHTSKTATATINYTLESQEGGYTDIDSDNDFDIFDLNILMVNWGSTDCGNRADLDHNCRVDIFDLNILMVNWLSN